MGINNFLSNKFFAKKIMPKKTKSSTTKKKMTQAEVRSTFIAAVNKFKKQKGHKKLKTFLKEEFKKKKAKK